MAANFSTPALFVELLSNVLTFSTKTNAVHAMSMKDEFTLRTPDAMLNGLATKRIIENCMPNIRDAGAILYCDMPQLLAALRMATTGPKLDITVGCPSCKNIDPYEINLQDMISTLSAKMWITPLKLEDLTIFIHPPTYDQYTAYALSDFRIAKQLYQIQQLKETTDAIADAVSMLLGQKQQLHQQYLMSKIAYIETNTGEIVSIRSYISDWFNQSDSKVQQKVQEHIQQAEQQCEIPSINAVCSVCKKEMRFPVDLDFCNQFRQKILFMDKEQILLEIKRMGNEVQTLTADLLKITWFMRGGISYSEAHNLTNFERTEIAKIIESNIEVTKKSGLPLL